MKKSIVSVLMDMWRQSVLCGRTRNGSGLCITGILRVVCVGFAADKVVLGQISV
jgi:hypothetical protein